MSWLNVGCGTHRAPAPWVNLDYHENDDTRPDRTTSPSMPFPVDLWGAERILLSHVLEHMALRELPEFFVHLRWALAPEGEVLVIGPDVYRTLERWKAGSEPTALMHSVMEHADYPGTTDWPHATHHWDGHEQRVLDILKLEGFTATALDRPPDDWPSWNWADWQFCIRARLENQ